jgi:hypothetical protein
MAALPEEIQELAPLAAPRRIPDETEWGAHGYRAWVVGVVRFPDERCFEAQPVLALFIALDPRYARGSSKRFLIMRLARDRRKTSPLKLERPFQKRNGRLSRCAQ